MAADDGLHPDDARTSVSDEALLALTERVAELERQLGLLTAESARPPLASPPIAGHAFQPMPAPAVVVAAAHHPSLEDRLGAQIFNLVGMVAILIGTSWALKLAFERGWVGPVGRVVIGLSAGVALILWSERFRGKGFRAFSYSLKALGSAVLYLSLWAGFQLYHVLPATAALAAMVLVTAWNGFMAWSQDAELLAAYGLVGGLLTPLLLSTGGNHEVFLFTYLGAIDLAIVVLLRWKPWRRLVLPALLGTIAYFIAWFTMFFHAGLQPDGSNSQAGVTGAFVVMFCGVFALVSVRGWAFSGAADGGTHSRARWGDALMPVLVPLANAAFVGLALYSVLEDSGAHAWLAWVMVALAAVYLALARIQASAMASAMHVAAAVVFLTIAIPLKASGHTLTTAWLVEGLVLFWASTRVGAGDADGPGRVLELLSGVGYVLGLGSLVSAYFFAGLGSEAIFFDANLGTALVAVAALGGGAWLAGAAVTRSASLGAGESTDTLWAFFVGVDFVALLLASREVGADPLRTAFFNPAFATALVALVILGASAWAAYDFAGRTLARRGDVVAGITLVLFNLVAVLSVEDEIGALWTRDNANLQRSLAISGFLMAYGAGLLAVGFWRRNAFVRWQALLLIIFTIAKVFLYDIGGLSQGYRVASFLGLGGLLMAVSFAYQKDWLGLRQAQTATSKDGGPA